MREIKFRAYNKKYGIHDGMQEVTSLFPRRKAVMCTNWRCKFEDIELMQYTGLKDKNGVEIFEGDIVKDAWDILMVVKYINTGFYLCRKNINGQYTKVSNWRNLNTKEVIGNIYENPELLEGR